MNKKNRKRLLAYTLRGKKSFFLGLFFTFIAVLAELAGPYLIGQILDDHLMSVSGVTNKPLFFKLLFFFGVALVLGALFRYASVYYLRKTADEVALAVQKDVFAHVQKLPLSFFDRFPAGKIVSRITNDTKDLRLLYQVVLSQLLTVGIFATGVYIALLQINRELFFMALMPLPFLWLIYRDYKKKSFYHNSVYRKNMSQLNADINEVIQGVEVIQAFNRQEETQQEFENLSKDIYRHGMGLVVLESYSGHNASGTLQWLVLAGALLYFGYGNITGAYGIK